MMLKIKVAELKEYLKAVLFSRKEEGIGLFHK